SISPGIVKTEYRKAARVVDKESDDDLQNQLHLEVDVADAIVYVLSTPPHVH
ncbi:hypothetical protein ILUMI_04850, partial [Ignelater luminosus]